MCLVSCKLSGMQQRIMLTPSYTVQLRLILFSYFSFVPGWESRKGSKRSERYNEKKDGVPRFRLTYPLVLLIGVAPFVAGWFLMAALLCWWENESPWLHPLSHASCLIQMLWTDGLRKQLLFFSSDLSCVLLHSLQFYSASKVKEFLLLSTLFYSCDILCIYHVFFFWLLHCMLHGKEVRPFPWLYISLLGWWKGSVVDHLITPARPIIFLKWNCQFARKFGTWWSELAVVCKIVPLSCLGFAIISPVCCCLSVPILPFPAFFSLYPSESDYHSSMDVTRWSNCKILNDV
jgi:hypothetical protein